MTVRLLDIGKRAKARIWSGAMPDATYTGIDIFSKTFPVESPRTLKKSLVAIEIAIPGVALRYGLLGGEFTPIRGNMLSVNVVVSDPLEQHFFSPLVSNRHEVHVGLPKEYVSGVFSGVEEAITHSSTIGAGTVTINIAAHELVGSSRKMFQIIARTLFGMLFLNETTLTKTDDDLRAMFPDSFS